MRERSAGKFLDRLPRGEKCPVYMILLSSRRVLPDLEFLKACFSTRCFDHLGEIQSDLRQADRSYIIAASPEGTHLHLAFIGNLLIDRKKATRDTQRRVT